MLRSPLIIALSGLTLSALLCLPAIGSSAPLAPTVDSLREKARECERKGSWTEACRIYDEILKRDRNVADKDNYQRCVRHVLQGRRHRDVTFKQALLALKPALAAEVYEDVLAKVRSHYAEPDQADINRLFLLGLGEFTFALEDESFIKEYLGQARRESIETFKSQLDQWRDKGLKTTREARDQVMSVALAARRSLGLEPAVVVLEFACGACNGLDEYTAYLTPSQFQEAQTAVKGELPRSVEATLFEGEERIGVAHILNFHENTVQELRDAIVQLRSMGLDALILDLRGNPGGSFRPAVQVAEMFLADGVIVLTQSRIKAFNRTYRADNPSAIDVPLVVLVDGDTGSAAEIVAGALKENQRATLVGQTTFGKGSIQAVLALEKLAAGIRITVAKFYSPANYPYAGRGVTPHDVVDAGPESQMIAARQVARRLASMMPR